MRISDWSSDVCSSDLPQHMIQKVLPSTTRAISKRHLPPLRRLPTRMSAFLTKRNSAQATTQSESLRYERSEFRALRSPKRFRKSRNTKLTKKPDTDTERPRDGHNGVKMLQ